MSWQWSKGSCWSCTLNTFGRLFSRIRQFPSKFSVCCHSVYGVLTRKPWKPHAAWRAIERLDEPNPGAVAQGARFPSLGLPERDVERPERRSEERRVGRECRQ